MKKFGLWVVCSLVFSGFLFGQSTVEDENLEDAVGSVIEENSEIKENSETEENSEIKENSEIEESLDIEGNTEAEKDFETEENSEGDEDSGIEVYDLKTVIPEKKRPKAADAEKAEAAAKKDENEKTVSEYKNTIMYGIASEISDLLDKLIENEDPRFSEDIYDLFQMSKSVDVKEKILNYFGKLEDPCLEDYAVTVVDDPFDEKRSTVKACFQYIQKVKSKAAVPAVIRLIENENEDYFNDALTTIGDIGSAKDAVKLTEFLDKPEITDAQKQSLMKTLGKIHAVETWDKLVEIAQNDDENMFVRMYAAEALGAMEKKESVPVLVELFEANDPNLRQYVLKGLEFFPDVLEAKSVIIQAIRDDHYKVRLEAIDAVKKQELKEAVPYLVYRGKNDPEEKIKMKSFEVLAFLNTQEGNDFLIERITEKKGNDGQKSKAVEVLLKEGHTGESEIKELALKMAEDYKRKSLRAAIGKHLAKYPRDSFDEVCVKYLESKDVTTQSQGLDMYQSGKYELAVPVMQKIIDDKKANAGVKRRARKLLNMEEE
ncbi:MAG: HEAT repeat domain-containing protein [Treponema sp.]|nr:HEAT repeat domain-containing protein [Treponema sp.]